MDAKITAITGVERRRMGELERLLHALHGWGGLLASQILHIRGEVSPDLFRAALDYMQASHPMLRAHIRPAGIGLRKGLPFMVVEQELVQPGTLPIPFRVAAGDWNDVLADELNTPIRGRRVPRIRAVLITPGADGLTRILLTMDHCIGDAQAGSMASASLMAFLGDPSLRRPAALGLPPALEDVHKRSDSGKRAEKVLRLPLTPRKGIRHETRVETRHFNVSELTALRASARKHRTTIHGTVAAAVLSAVHELYGSKAMTVDSTFDLRRLCNPVIPPDTFGCYVDALRTTHALGRDFWDTAREVAFKLVGALAKDQESASICKLPSLPFFFEQAMPLIRSGFRMDGIGLTTGGDLGLERHYGKFILEDATVGISMQWAGPGFFVCTTERHGELSLSLSYAPYIVPRADAARLVDHAAALLRNLPA